MDTVIEMLKAILFGIVEGVTEWLPISSTGHMILLDKFVKLNVTDAFYEMFQVVIQLGAILAVVVLFFKKLNPLDPSKKKHQKQMTWALWFKVIVAVLPSAVIGLLLDDLFTALFFNWYTVAIALIVFGIAFIVIENKHKNVEPKVKSRTLIIPGKVAVLKGDIEAKLPGWKVIVGPNEAVQLVKFLKDMNA